MSNAIIDLVGIRQSTSISVLLEHPVGVVLPFAGQADAALISPETRNDIRSGAYSTDLVRLLPDAIEPGDRVLVLGANLGLASTLVARDSGVARVIAAEADAECSAYLSRVHALNGVRSVETINAVMAVKKPDRVPLVTRRGQRGVSGALPKRSLEELIAVPSMDLDLILAEELITLIVCDVASVSARVLAKAELRHVERIVLNFSSDPAQCWKKDGLCAELVAQGFFPQPCGNAIMLRRDGSNRMEPARALTPANSNVAPTSLAGTLSIGT